MNQSTDNPEPAATGEQARLEARLLVLGRLAAGVGHELRNPLSVIHNALYFLRRHLVTGEEVDDRVVEYLDIIDDELRAADRLIDNLLNASRRLDPEPSVVDLDALVTRVVADLGPSPGVRWEYLAEPDAELCTDRQMLRQILRNLIENALQAVGDTGCLRLRVHREGEAVELCLSDDGPGVAEAHAAYVFDPLYTTRPRGNGLGLWLARELAERLGGTLSLVDGELGGAGFCLRLPDLG